MSTWNNQEKTGNTQGWEYNEVGYTYNQLTDPESGATVKYNSVGDAVTFTNLNKN